MMNYILNIHTSAEKAIVNICNEDHVLETSVNTEQKQHASFLHPAIKNMLDKNNISLSGLKAIGVSGGPGSYTGIRVGLATAKGLCYALKIPMMMYNSLELMAFSAIGDFPEIEKNALFSPMIDARRMEVFNAVYDLELNEIRPSEAIVLDDKSFSDIPPAIPFYYFGSGAEKFKKLIENTPTDYHYIQSGISTESLARFGWYKFQKNDFENLVNSKPLYVKDFYTKGKTG
jgi:tRNA threonylcarbamoyladenosine biosynthesis protein TsaB